MRMFWISIGSLWLFVAVVLVATDFVHSAASAGWNPRTFLEIMRDAPVATNGPFAAKWLTGPDTGEMVRDTLRVVANLPASIVIAVGGVIILGYGISRDM